MARPREHNEIISYGVGCIGIILTQGQIAVIDAKDLTAVYGFKWHARCCRGVWYAYTNGGENKSLGMHVVLCNPTQDSCIEVDHKDGDGLNNRRSNLRRASHSQNMYNTYNRGEGISWDGSGSGFWRASIYAPDGRIRRSFRSLREARECRLLMEQIVHGDFTRDNHV